MGRNDSDGTSLGEGTVQHSTDKALLIALEDVGEEKWIPRSVIHDDSEVYDDTKDASEGEVIVATWWAEKEGLV